MKWDPSEIMPSRDALLSFESAEKTAAQGKLARLIDTAKSVFMTKASPVGMAQEVSQEAFQPIFEGEGLNENPAPLRPVLSHAERLSLFAITLGPEVSRAIEKLFAENDFALGYVLDHLASRACEKAVRTLEGMAVSENPTWATLSYSPGYCGWHITAQRRLFETLKPSQIGISLNESCLMVPLKSVSGVLASGPKEIHQLGGGYSVCQSCRYPTCRERMKSLSLSREED